MKKIIKMAIMPAMAIFLLATYPAIGQTTSDADASTTAMTESDDDDDKDYGWIGLLGLAGLLGLKRNKDNHNHKTTVNH
ncbi:MAG TPA: WGxxGxxG family protein [Pedobacter sp.]|jgi:hypothetical protein